MPVDKRESIHHQLDTCGDAALAELMTLTVSTDEFGDTIYRNHLGQRHRIHGPAVIFTDDGTLTWYQNDKCHREDGPAVEQLDGSKMWCIDGRVHRVDGPAIEWPDGRKEWWLDGKQVTRKQHKKKIIAIQLEAALGKKDK